jgi:hypothetical protein
MKGGCTVSIPQIEPTDSSLYTICEHIKPGGERCGSPALRDEKYCYYHTDVRKRIPKVNLMVTLWNPHPESDPNYRYDMPYLEDPEALQMALTQFIHVVSQERIKVDRAKLVLSALYCASLNLRLMEKGARRKATSAAKKAPATVEAESARCAVKAGAGA